LSTHKLKQGHVQGVLKCYDQLKRVSEQLEAIALTIEDEQV